MSWAALLAFGAASYAIKAIGPVVVGKRELPGWAMQALNLLPVAMLAAIVLVGTLDGGRKLQVDARLAGLAVAAVLIWRKAPFLVVIVAAAAVTAAIRAL